MINTYSAILLPDNIYGPSLFVDSHATFSLRLSTGLIRANEVAAVVLISDLDCDYDESMPNTNLFFSSSVTLSMNAQSS